MGDTTLTIEDFYKQKFEAVPEGFSWDEAHFNIFRMDEDPVEKKKGPVRYTRKDFYKIALVRGKCVFHYAEKRFELDGDTLIFFNPLVPYIWESLHSGKGVFCIFNASFFTDNLHTSLRDLPMFVPGNNPTYALDDTQSTEIERLFEKMISNLSSTYRLKYDLIRNYIIEILHFALKLQPSESLYQHSNANARITSLFIDMLERQFPIETPDQQLALRSPGDFAVRLSVHVNHLNRAIRETTGKTTSSLIAERVTAEAKALLKHTNWNISEISYTLGFEEMAHFDNFFRKHTASTPSAYRVL